MKIGIYTQPLSHNYGGILQNYALQQVLKRMGHNPITIHHGQKNYWSNAKCIIHNLLRPLTKQPYWGVVSIKKLNKLKAPFKPFIKRYIHATKSVVKCTPEFIKRQHFGAIIVGSDQVWRPRYNDIYASYLSIAKDIAIPKIAYAASFGVDRWEYTPEQTNQCCELIKQFKAVSVREASGVNLCKKYLNTDAIEVLDPTLLLNRTDYRKLCHNIKCESEKYLLVYILDEDKDKELYVTEFAKQHNLVVKQIHAENQVSMSVEEWLSLFRDAAYVVTDSFHGTVFSILFLKEFISLVNEGRGASRFESLLNKLQLSDRLIVDNQSIPSGQIDWENVSDLLEKYRKESMLFLENAIKN